MLSCKHITLALLFNMQREATYEVTQGVSPIDVFGLGTPQRHDDSANRRLSALIVSSDSSSDDQERTHKDQLGCQCPAGYFLGC